MPCEDCGKILPKRKLQGLDGDSSTTDLQLKFVYIWNTDIWSVSFEIKLVLIEVPILNAFAAVKFIFLQWVFLKTMTHTPQNKEILLR